MRLLISILSLFLLCQEAGAEILHLSTGYGRTREEAIFDAKRDAIAHSTGEYINQRTIMSGDKISTDYVSAINGIVTSYDIINDFDTKTKQVFIRCHIQEGKVAALVNKNEVKQLDHAALTELYKNHENQLEAIYDLYSDESLIYDVNVGSVEASVDGQNYCYDINLSIKQNDSWTKKRSEIYRLFDKTLIARFGEPSGMPYVRTGLVRLVDEENKIELPLDAFIKANWATNSTKRGFFFLGADYDYDRDYKICRPQQYTKFSFKFKMVGKGSYFSKVGYAPEDKELFDISRVAKLQDKYY